MEPSITIAGYWLLFAGTHIGLATAPIRGRLVQRLGEVGFAAVFSLVATVTFALLVRAYAALHFEGALGLGLASVTGVRELLLVVSGAAMLLALASFARYPASPYAVYGGRHNADPHGMERVSRHAFFAAMALFGAAHALLATRLVGTVFFGVLAVYSTLGAWHQDRKLLALRGAPYERYLAATSMIPFAAILAGRQRLVLRELPWLHLAAGLGLAVGLRAVHGAILSAGGAWVVAAVIGVAVVAGAESWWHARHAPRRTPSAVGTQPRHV